MKLVEKVDLVSVGQFSTSSTLQQLKGDVEDAILAVKWPLGATDFSINPSVKGNGVNLIKKDFVATLKLRGWKIESPSLIIDGAGPGCIDAVKMFNSEKFAVEWETGNISSTHRALNKIALGIKQGHLIGGILVLPKRSLARYLTDRIGNFEEIKPYLPLYDYPQITNGYFGVYVVDADQIDHQVPLIPKGKDGNAAK